jgi:hypothetical protein
VIGIVFEGLSEFRASPNVDHAEISRACEAAALIDRHYKMVNNG